MNVLLTPPLLAFLQNEGYTYCLSKTELQPVGDDVLIKLLPVHTEPDVTNIPQPYDTYFDIDDEPAQMADGVDGLTVVMKLDYATLRNYINFTLKASSILGSVEHD